MKLPGAVWYLQELYETFSRLRLVREQSNAFENWLSFPRTVQIFRELFESPENCSQNCLKISQDCLTLPSTMSDSENTPQETMEE